MVNKQRRQGQNTSLQPLAATVFKSNEQRGGSNKQAEQNTSPKATGLS